MPKTLRDAIASVRRVSHEMHEPPARGGVTRFRSPPGTEPADEPASFDQVEPGDLPFRQHRPADEPRFGMAAGRFEGHGLHEDPPLSTAYDDRADAYEGRASARQWDQGADPDEPEWRDEPTIHGAAGPLGRAPSAALPLDDDADELAPQGVRAAPRHPLPPWRQESPRRRSHLATLAIAIVFLALAGVGFAFFSGSQEVDRWMASLGLTPLAGAMVGPPEVEPPSPAPPSRSVEPPAPVEPPQLSELETVEVAPLPAPPESEELPPALRVNGMPLPPPPKPPLEPSRSAEGGAANDGIPQAVDRAIEQAALVVPQAGGAGGPFEPIVARPGTEPRVFVHFAEDVPGSPAAALDLVRKLRAAGFQVEGRPVHFPVRENSVRYFFESDRAAAEAVKAQLESQIPGDDQVAILDFTGYEPKPRQGHLEVWLGR